MKFRRLFASVSAGFEDFVSKVENHEAVADCVIDDMRRATAQVRVQHGRIESQIIRFEKQCDQLATDEARWNERAVSLAEQDEARALECVSRARQAARRREALVTQLGEHRQVAADLKSRLADLEERLAALQLKRTALSSRAARAQTLSKAERVGITESVDAVFERWETAVLTEEYCDNVTSTGADALEREFTAAEDAADLKAHLEALKAAGGGQS